MLHKILAQIARWVKEYFPTELLFATDLPTESFIYVSDCSGRGVLISQASLSSHIAFRARLPPMPGSRCRMRVAACIGRDLHNLEARALKQD
jgi:hypothetical protein